MFRLAWTSNRFRSWRSGATARYTSWLPSRSLNQVTAAVPEPNARSGYFEAIPSSSVRRTGDTGVSPASATTRKISSVRVPAVASKTTQALPSPSIAALTFQVVGPASASRRAGESGRPARSRSNHCAQTASSPARSPFSIQAQNRRWSSTRAITFRPRRAGLDNVRLHRGPASSARPQAATCVTDAPDGDSAYHATTSSEPAAASCTSYEKLGVSVKRRGGPVGRPSMSRSRV